MNKVRVEFKEVVTYTVQMELTDSALAELKKCEQGEVSITDPPGSTERNVYDLLEGHARVEKISNSEMEYTDITIEKGK